MVGIVLVNYNGAEDTIECVKSLKDITFCDYRIIVVDNNSSDSSLDLLEKYKDIYRYDLLSADYNGGFSYGNNLGIKRSLEIGADYVLLLNNDTIVEKDFLEELLLGFEYSENCGAVIGKIKYENDRNKIWYAGGSLDRTTSKTIHYMYQQDDNDDQSLRLVSFATGCCMCLSREAIEEVGLLDESYFLYEEDADYSFRLNEAGFDIVYTPRSVIYHKIGASNIGANRQYYMVRNKLFMIKKHFEGFKKMIAYSYVVMQSIFRCIKKEYDFKVMARSFSDFLKNKTGMLSE